MKREGNKPQEKKVSRRDFVRGAAVGVGGAALTGLGATDALARAPQLKWDKEADVVIVGAGATGLPAAIEAREHSASVIIIEANFDVGGHAIVSGGNIALGGGSSRQKKWGVQDSPDIVFSDLTDWSVIEPNGFPDYRYNDKEIIRAFADTCGPTVDWLMEHGVVFVDKMPDTAGGHATGNSAPRENHAAAMDWPLMQTGAPVEADKGPITSSGIGFIRPVEASARKLGVQFLLEHKMTNLVRENTNSGRLLGIEATNEGKTLRIRAKKGVIIATGGHSSNVNFRRIFDPRLTEEYDGVAGEPYSYQDASGEIAAMAIGASLWGAYNQVAEFGQNVTKPGSIGSQYGYVNLIWQPGSKIFSKARASGLHVKDWQDLILVNQAGLRFYDETKGQYTANNYGDVKPYKPDSYLNAAHEKWDPANFLNAAMAGTGEPHNGGGPIWAIFDADAAKREGWITTPPHVDIEAGYFFSANSLAELAAHIVNKHQHKPMPGDVLQSTVAKYNSFVDAGADADFGKLSPKFKIQTPPFYAAWATPVVHDSRAGLRINAKCQVIDLNGNVIPGLYCGGESAGGFSMHGMGRCIVQGRIAGRNAAAEPEGKA
ncbi:MAG TPA: FAD-dependent oxidoreductase [Candidatus Acidoferrales bacterium]|jgi:succinate dehydrogenase/fumarate reductase flavoprotein subunit|nr:FAD-dependent oxidoreductase [Candidatus Acidoferrales bacterium]